MGGTPGIEPSEIPERREPGDVVAIREVWGRKVWYARPAIVVRDDPNLVSLYVPPHVRCKEPVGPDGTSLRIPTAAWNLADVERGPASMLSFAFPDTPYAVILGYTGPGGDLFEYYVNLQTPLRRSVAGFDTVEHVLDVVIEPDRSSWRWKDEDELADAVAAGLFTHEDVAWFRHWGERAVEHVLLREPPFDEDWDGWHPDPSWREAELPPTWDVAPA